MLSKIGNVYEKKISKKKFNEINILFVRFKYLIDKNFIDKYPNLKFIISATTGIDHINQSYCKKKKITIYSLNDIKNQIQNISTTADLSFGLILNLLRNISHSSKKILNKKKFDRYEFITHDIKKISLGIIGYGRVGRKVKKYAKFFGIKTLYCDKLLDKKNYKKKFYNLVSNVDIISINANVIDKKKIIDTKEIKMMKKNAIIVNTSRSSLVNEDAIAKAILSKNLFGYATDVISNERDIKKLKNSKLFKLSKNGYNVLITPHIGGCTYESINKAEFLITKYFVDSNKIINL